MTTTHTITTNDDFPGLAFIIPTDWETTLSTLGEDANDWDSWDAASTLTDELAAVEVEWSEDETFETFEDAVKAAGFTVAGRGAGGEYPAVRA